MANDNKLSLDDLFRHANIDDVWYNEPEDEVELHFSMRQSKVRFEVYGDTLDDAVDSAARIIADQLTLERLKTEGLNDDDIARLSETHFETIDELAGDPGEVWQRGYLAGITDTLDTAVASGLAGLAARQGPALAAAGEPVGEMPVGEMVDPEEILEGLTANPAEALRQHPYMAVLYKPIAIVQV